MRSKIIEHCDRLLVVRFSAESDEIDEVVGVTEEEIHLLVQHLQEKLPGRSVLEYLNSRYSK